MKESGHADDKTSSCAAANLDNRLNEAKHDSSTVSPPSLPKTISWDKKRTAQVVGMLVLIVGIALAEATSNYSISKTMQAVSDASYAGFFRFGSAFFSLVHHAWSLAEATRDAVVQFFSSFSNPFSIWLSSILKLFNPLVDLLRDCVFYTWKTSISVCMYALDGFHRLVKALICLVASPSGFFDGYSQEWKEWISNTTSEEERILGLMCALGGLAALIGVCMALFGAFLEQSAKSNPAVAH